MIDLSQEEYDWLDKPKGSWTKGGWSDRVQWLRAVLGEYRRIKATARSSEEAESNLKVLVLRIKSGEFLPSLYGL